MKKVLVVAPHADDETLGVGGTIARHVAEGDEVTVAVMTGHGKEPHPLWGPEAWDTVRGEALEAWRILGVQHWLFRELPAACVADRPTYEVNQVCDEVLKTVGPDVLYVPFQYDLHLDHRVLFYGFSVAYRTHAPTGRKVSEIYAYEVPSETHWNFHSVEPGFQPNVWVDISEHLDTKLKALACFESQIRPFPDSRSVKAVEAMAHFRGSQMNMAAAEAFVTVRSLRNAG